MIDAKVKYLKVKDAAGQEYLCPLDALKTLQQATAEDLANCVEAEVVGRYSSDHEVVDK